MNGRRLTTERRPSRRSIVASSLSCLALGIAAGNVIALILFAIVFAARLIAR